MELPERIGAPSDAPTDTTLNEEPVENRDENNVKDVTPTCGELLEALSNIAAADGADISNEEVARVKQQFYTLHNENVRRMKAEFVEAGNDPEAFTPAEDETEAKFKQTLAAIKEKKAEHRAKVEAEQLKNLELKRAIVTELEGMSADTDTVYLHHQRAKELQAEFKTIGEVPATEATQIWKAFQDAVERFYDQWKVNKELRDYDFKKNLAEKQLLLEEAVRLNEEPDVITAFRRLQELHSKWRDIGPVAKDVREEIWTRFKDASAEVSKRYQAHFEERKNRERQNEEAKNAICERIEALDFSAPSTYSEWDAMTATIIEAQNEWKTLGYASKKANNALFARFRALCDDFFARKAAFFKQMKNELSENLAKKTALCEQAEQLAESEEWRKTSDKIIALQKEWKTIGPVARKQSDAIWQRFMKACDTFFERKKKNAAGTKKTEQANLAAKRDIIAQLTALNAPEATAERTEAIAKINELRTAWQNTGHVPFKEKDKLQEAYREVVGELFEKYDIREQRARMESFEAGIAAAGNDTGKIARERDKLLRAYEQRKQELNTYENNLGFLSATSKSGSTLIRDMEKKMQRLRDDINEISKKIAIIDAKK